MINFVCFCFVLFFPMFCCEPHTCQDLWRLRISIKVLLFSSTSRLLRWISPNPFFHRPSALHQLWCREAPQHFLQTSSFRFFFFFRQKKWIHDMLGNEVVLTFGQNSHHSWGRSTIKKKYIKKKAAVHHSFSCRFRSLLNRIQVEEVCGCWWMWWLGQLGLAADDLPDLELRSEQVHDDGWMLEFNVDINI